MTVDVDAEESTLLSSQGDVEKLKEGDDTIIGKTRRVTIGPGDFEAVIVGGSYNIDLPRTTRLKSQVTIFIPPGEHQKSQTMTLGLDTEFTSLGLAEMASPRESGSRWRIRFLSFSSSLMKTPTTAVSYP